MIKVIMIVILIMIIMIIIVVMRRCGRGAGRGQGARAAGGPRIGATQRDPTPRNKNTVNELSVVCVCVFNEFVHFIIPIHEPFCHIHVGQIGRKVCEDFGFLGAVPISLM